MEGLKKLREKFPFPNPSKKLEKKFIDGRPKGWCHIDNINHFRIITDKKNPIIIDGGSYMGLSAWWWLTIYPESTVICIDHWKGSIEHQQEKFKDEIENLYDYFLSNLSEYSNRVIPIQTDSISGLNLVKEFEITPDIIWIDWSHDIKSVIKDVGVALLNFPDAVVCGDDWTWDGVKKGLAEIKHLFGVEIYSGYSFWRILR